MQWAIRKSFSSTKRKSKNRQNASEHEFPEGLMEVQGDYEVLVRIPRAVVHLVDGYEENVELGSGEFTLIKLLQGNTGLAILAKVGDDLSWPMTKDEPTVKVDSCHYLFSVRPPNVVEEMADSAKCGSEMLNYGVTFEGREGLDMLDKCLEHHASFSSPKNGDSGKDGGKPASEAAYWADLAPKVDDYNSMLAKAIASGTGQIIKGLFHCSNGYSSQVQKGGEFVRRQTKAKNKPSEVGVKKGSEINSATKTNIKRVKMLSRMSEKMSENVLKGVIRVSGAVTGPILTSKPGKKFFAMLPGEVLLASLDAINQVMDAVEVAGKDVLSTTSDVTTSIIGHRYGEDAREMNQDVFEVAGNAFGTAINVIKLRKAINPVKNGNVSASVIKKKSFKEVNKDLK